MHTLASATDQTPVTCSPCPDLPRIMFACTLIRLTLPASCTASAAHTGVDPGAWGIGARTESQNRTCQGFVDTCTQHAWMSNKQARPLQRYPTCLRRAPERRQRRALSTAVSACKCGCWHVDALRLPCKSSSHPPAPLPRPQVHRPGCAHPRHPPPRPRALDQDEDSGTRGAGACAREGASACVFANRTRRGPQAGRCQPLRCTDWCTFYPWLA